MTTLFAEQALLPDGWRRNVRLAIDGRRIAAVEPEAAAAQRGDERHAILLPGMANLHSHAFQRGMAGLAERRGPGPDTFWTWREVMYRFALTMTPDQAEAVAAQLYVEMLEAGFTRVGEFHYLHHDRDGRPYANLAEMAERIAAAAAGDRDRPDAAAGVLRAWQFRRRRAKRGPAALPVRRRRLRAAHGGEPQARRGPAGDGGGGGAAQPARGGAGGARPRSSRWPATVPSTSTPPSR